MASTHTPKAPHIAATPHNLQNQVDGLSRLLSVARHAREAETLEDVYFLAVNETHQLATYDQALIWLDNGFGKPDIKAISGIASFDKNAPKIVWLHKLAAYLQKSGPRKPVQKIGPDMLPASLANTNQDYIGAHTLYVPFEIKGEKRKGGVLFLRGEAWPDNEVKIIDEACKNYIYALSYFHRKPRKLVIKSLMKRVLMLALFAGILYTLSLPTQLSIIAPMEIKAHNPWIATSPHEGVIKEMHVKPNQAVKAGDLIISLEDTKIRNEVALAEKELNTKLSELRQARQQSMTADPAREGRGADAKLLELETEQKQAEITYLKELLGQTKIYAAEDGIAVFNSPHEWKGRPVRVGERILALADPQDVEVQILMPVEDAITIDTRKKAALFLNTDPLHPRPAQISRISYKAETFPDGTMSYIVTATLADNKDLPRIGLKGNARLYGEDVSLFYNLFRRPLAYLKRKFMF